MFEVFKHNIVQELGPLCPNWFEELTASAARDEASAPDPETSSRDCVQEASLRTPARKLTVDSQIFSTPKIFKSHTARSPEVLTTDEELFSPERGAAGGSKTIPWVDTSLCFFGSDKNGQTVDKLCNTRLPLDDSEFLPKSLVAVSAKSISESLGAQLDPDVSWTSSLNTPPAMAPTVILTAKEEDKAHPVSPSGNKRVILVRELFPSMSKAFQMAEISSEKPGLFGQPSELNSQLRCLKKESHCQKLSSVDENDVLWKQTLPDAIQDGEVRSTVASVLDGAEDVLSIFFSNSSSALRRVKAKERIRNRQTSSAKAAELTPAPALENGSPEDPAKLSGQAEHVKDAFAFHEGNSPETKDCGITQWTPLTLPDISDTGAGTDFCAAPSSDELAERQADTPQLERLAKGDESSSSDIMVPGGALAYCDSVLPTDVANTRGKNVRPFHSAFPQQRPEASKRTRSGDSQPVLLLNPPLLESKPCWDPGKCSMPESGPGNSACSAEMQSGMLVPRPGESPLPGSSLEGCPAVTSTRKPPRKFVYSLQNSRLPGQANYNQSANSHRHTVSTQIVQSSGEILNGNQGGHTVISSIKTLQHSDNVAKDKSECKKLCEQAGNARMEVVPTASNEAEMPLLCATSAEDYNQEGNPDRAPRSSSDMLDRDTDTNFSETKCPNVIGLEQPSQPSPPKLTEIPGSADDHRGHDIASCPSHSTAALTESIQATEMSGLPSVSATTRITCESQRRDSGYHTTWSDATQLHGSSDTVVSGSRNTAESHAPMGFKMASNRIISLPPEAIQTAKAFLDEAAQDSLIKTSVSKGKGPPVSTEWTGKSHYNGVKSSLVGKAAASRHGTSLSKVSSAHNSRSSLQGSSENPGFLGFKTASNSLIRLSPANLLKAKQLFKDIEDEKLSEGSSRTSCTDRNALGEVKAENGMSKRTVGLMAGPILTLPSSEQKGSEANGCLTASQRADVTELCSLLEEANSQFEFTQFKQAKFTSTGSDDGNHPCDKEVDPDFLTGIDFDDSFSSDCERQGPRKRLADTFMPEKLTANSCHKQNGQDSGFKTKPVEMLSCDFSGKNVSCVDTSHLGHHSASLVPDNTCDPGSFAAFSSASGKKITVSKEVLTRASKVFDDVDVGFVPLQNSVCERRTDSSHSNVLGAIITKVQRAGNIPGTHVTFNTPRSNVINQNHYIRTTSLSPGGVSTDEGSLEVGVSSGDAKTIQEECTISVSNLPSGEPGPPLMYSSLQTVNINLKSARTNFSGALLPPSGLNGLGTDGRSDEHPTPTPALNSSAGEKICIDKAVSKQPRAVCPKDSLQNNTCKLEIAYKHPNGISTKPGAGFQTARGTAVNVSERLLRKAREMFSDLEENPQSAQEQDRRADEQERRNVVIENKDLPDRCGDPTNNANARSEKCKSENDALIAQRTLAAYYEADKSDAIHVENEIDMTSVHKRASPSTMASESNISQKLACENKVCLADKALLETTSNEYGRISASCQMTVVSDEGSSNISTFNVQGNCGFSTAGGKNLAVSKKSLEYAQFLLDKCAEMKTPEPGETSSSGHFSSRSLPGGNSVGFRTASGKGVSISPNALVQAKAMFQNCDDAAVCELSGAVIRDGINGETGDGPINPLPASSGLFSANGKGVSISAKALLEVKDMFRGSNGVVDGAVRYGPIDVNKNAKSFELHSNLGKVNCGFSSAGGKRVSVSEKALLRANAFLKECDQNHHLESKRQEFLKGSTRDPQHKNSCGFSTASGKRVPVSLKALQEANARFADCDVASLPEISDAKAEPVSKNSTSAREDSLKSNCGFSTASGKGVSVSKKALLKAKTLLNECCDVESGEPVRPLKMASTTSSVPNPQCERDFGFSTGSGKGPSNSVKDIYEPGSALKDCPNDKITEEIQGNNLKVNTGSCTNPGKCNSGFSTARGNRVSVSVKALEEAKAKFRDCDNLDHVFSEEIKVEPVKNDSSYTHHNPDETASGASTVDEKTVSASEITPQSTNPVPVKSDRIEHSVVTSSYKCIPQGPIPQKGKAPMCRSVSVPARERSAPGKAAGETVVCETTQNNAGGPTQRSSSLNLRSLGLGNCTDTQQRYMEQEAMACTKALLDDEDLAEQGLQEAPGKRSLQENAPMQSAAVEEAERRQARVKRLKSEDSTDQPPLKRRLLADFEETSDNDKLAPVKSSPNVILRDRRIFRYGVPLQPNVTRPPSDKKGILDQRRRITEPQIVVPGSFLQDGKPANPRGAVFVPPFRRCPKPEVQGTNLPQESRRPPSLFVPPFRKTQPNVPLEQGPGQASSSLSEAPPLPAVFVPPFKKTEGSASHPGSEENMSVPESGIHHAVPHNTCDGPVSRQGPATPNVPAEREAEGEGPTLAPPSPEHHEASSSDADAQTLQNLQLARDLQDMRIRKKRRQRIRPQPGSLLLAKTAGVTRVPLRSAVGGKCPVLHSQKELYACGVPRGVSQISSDSAESFRFHCRDFLRGEALTAGGGVQLADGGWLVPSDDGTAGKEQFYRALCDTPGVDPKLISEGWLYNHYRWVVWKRASMERAFPSVMGSHCLTPEQVLLQLKYRYDVEVDQSRRSALRKVMERDDTPAKTMVLCVCGVASTGSAPAGPVQPESKTSPGSGIKAGGSPCGVIWVTDGWYAIKALLDAPLTAMLLKGRLAVGGKVVTHGAELVGSQDACPPLEAPESLMLKISANSTRPARWDAKLGFHCDPRPFRLPLSSLYSNGGLVGSVDIVVLRSYPTQWMEKKPGGAFVFRNNRTEERESRRHGDSRHKAMEVLFTKVQAQFEKEEDTKPAVKGRRRRLTCQEMEALQDGEELHDAVETDPVYLESCLNEQQLAVLSSYRQSLGQERQAKLQERFRQALAEAQENEGSCSNRDVTPVWKLSVCDFVEQQSNSVYVLSIWRPSAELRSLLREGCRYRVYQLATSQGKKQPGRAAVQLTATKKTQFQHIQAPIESLCELFQPRVSSSFRALQGPSFHPVGGEVDTVGYVISIADRHGPSPVLYLADEHQDFVSVRINGSLAQLALEELVKPQALLALSNLKLQPQSPMPIPGLYAGELALFASNPKEPHLQEACTHLRNVAQGNEHYFQMAEEQLSNFMLPNVQSSLLSPREVCPSPKMVNGQIPQQSVRVSGLFTPVSRRPPLPASTSEDRDPKSLKRKRGLDFLSRIPSPPPLGPLWGNASPSVKKTFNPPRRSEPGRPASSRPALPPTPPPYRAPAPAPQEEVWVNDEELAMINTQALLGRQEETGVCR